MNRLARKGLVSAMVAGGVLASAGYAQADAAAEGDTAGSPGVLSGNSVQVPVNVPVNVCGNTISVVGLLNSVSGNACANRSSSQASSVSGTRDAAGSPAGSARTGRHAGRAADESAGSSSGGGAHAAGDSRGSAGVLSGNGLKLPVDLPLNVSGNGVNVVGVGNPSFGNTAVNDDTPPAPPAHLPVPAPPASLPDQVSPAETAPALAHTGADGVGTAAAGSLALLLGGTVLYRRSRAAARR
ncbi:chaplin [Actinacidiphila bryophytorum]|uniref:chaplin n=1 Tax=Actinacidiphila bryophytorum TaxID=1436133 RepID=UPI002176A620|nr:chaplin [Actinacidiphila bryophytorum]UWE09558.1 chaplin [Actinacidiphila bryophytorum]